MARTSGLVLRKTVVGPKIGPATVFTGMGPWHGSGVGFSRCRL